MPSYLTIPFGFIHFKLAKMALWPIGAKVVSKELATVFLPFHSSIIMIFM